MSTGHSPIVEPGLQSLVADCVESGKLHATSRPLQALENADVSLLCVGTPSTSSGEANLTQVFRVIEDLIQLLTDSLPARAFHVVAIRSTVPPGTVDDVAAILQPAFGDSGSDVAVAMCPEFLREGSAFRTSIHPRTP